MDRIGEKIKAIRKSKGITQGFISMLENNINEAGIVSIMKIAKALYCSINELVGTEGKSA